MSGTVRDKLAEAIAESYDIASAARKCNLTVSEARVMLTEETKSLIDRAVLRRVLGTSAELTRRAIDEFTRIAFASDDECKVADRIRALEQLFKLTPKDGKSEAGESDEDRLQPLTIIYDYRGADGD